MQCAKVTKADSRNQNASRKDAKAQRFFLFFMTENLEKGLKRGVWSWKF